MSDLSGNTASSASARPSKRDTALTLSTVVRMLPLVRRVVDDIQQAQKILDRLVPEKNGLDRDRVKLSWPERARRYQLREDLVNWELRLQDAPAEMEVLGVDLLDAELGRVGFPTIVNGKRAYFTWQPGEEAVHFWQFASEKALRRIPAAWLEETQAVTR